MAVISKHVAASLKLCDQDDKTIHSYHGLRPAALPGFLSLFSDAVGDIRNEDVGSTFLTTVTELEEV